MENILIIDSDKYLFKEISVFLEDKGFNIIGAEDGASGITKALEVLPDIVLCNFDLPDIDGYEVQKKLQQNKSTATIPFVFLMDKTSIKDIRKAMKMGADDCLVKPWNFDELIEVIKTRFNKKQRIIDERSKKVQRQEQYLRTILQTTKDGFWIVNHKGKIIDVNDTYCQMTGFTREEVLEMTIRDMDAIETDQEAMDRMVRVKKNGSEIFETRLWRKDKKQFDAEISVTYLDIKKGQFICFCRDITQRKRAEKKITSYASMLDLAPSAIAIHDLEGNFLFSNQKNLQWHGYTFEEFLQLSIHDLDVPESRELIEERIEKIKKEGEASFEVKHFRKDGSIIPLLLFVKKIVWDEKPAMLSIGTDISEQKKAKEELIHSHNLMQYIIEHNRSAVAVHDKNLHYIYVSKSYLDQYKIKEKNIIGKHHYEVFPNLPQKWRDVHQKALKGIVSSAEDDPYYKEDGSVEWTRWECRPWYESDGSIGGIIIYTEVITERKKAEEALRSNYALLQIAGETARFGGWSVDLENNITTWSDAVADIHEVSHGYSPTVNEAISFYTKKWRDKITHVFNDCVHKGIPFDEEMEIITAKGKHVWVRTNGRPIKDKNGKITKVQGSFQDITERKQADQLLIEQKNLLSAIFRNTPFLMMVVNSERRVQKINGYAKQFAGRNTEEMIGLLSGEALRCMHALDDPKGCGFGKFCQQCVIRNSVLDTLETGETHLQEEAPYFFKEKDDKIREMTFMTSTTAIMVKGERMVLVTLQDITQRKQAEKALKESEQRFRYLFRDIPTVAVQGYQFDGKTIYWNKASENLYGYTAEEAIGRNLFDLIIPQEMHENVRNEIQQMYKSMKPARASEMSLIRKDGTRISVFSSHAIVQRHEHEPELFCLDIDITQRKKAEIMLQERNEIIQAQNEEYESINEELRQTNEELIEAKEKAEESDRLKSAFLANMSHEIRTPMNSILGFSSLLGKDNLSEKNRKHYIKIIQASGRNLVQIINDVIDIAMIESGQMKISKTEVSLNQLFYDLYHIFLEKIKTDNLNIQLNLKIPDKEHTLVTDELRVKQILSNFLFNALKFTEKGEVTFGFRCMRNHKVRFFVKDTGVGIPQDKFEMIFERFRQADDSTTRKYGGTGLGLAISKNLAELLNSEIVVKSELNKGSEFYFTLSENQV
ncbi:MAG: PAS domain S-box protein [Thiohalospira sp.]